MSSTAPIVVVTEPEFRRAEAVFNSSPLTCVAAPPLEADVVQAIRATGARHAVLGPFVYKDSLYAALPPGGVIARYGVGHDGVDKARATRAGLFCTNTPGVLHQSVAELTLLLSLAGARHFEQLTRSMRAGQWSPRPGVELRGKTLALVGCGTIGRATAQIAKAGFGMRVVGFRRSGGAPAGDEDFDVITSDFADAVQGADYISLHIPASSANMGFINEERLSLFEKHAWLINTARGAVVDEGALYDALAGESIGGAAIDVYDREPYEPAVAGKDLRTLSNAIVVPHIGSNTAEANIRMAERALRNITLAERGQFAQMDLLNPDVLAGPGAR
jgi:lactate dehydrogenase-like 2-hydroxyacid dehydrogenase